MAGPVRKDLATHLKKLREMDKEKYRNRSNAEEIVQEHEDEANIRKNGTALQRKRQAKIPAIDRAAIMRENGAASYRAEHTRDERNRQMGALVTRNLKKAADSRAGGRNYNQESAAASTKARMEKEEKLKKQKDLQRYINRLKKW